MFEKSLPTKPLVALILVVGLVSTASNASIDRSPVKVTNSNSGPIYDLAEDVERVKIPADSDESSSFDERRRWFTNNFPKKPSSEGSNDNSDSPAETGLASPDVGRISIRRIFIVPMMPPTSSGDSDNNNEASNDQSRSSFNPFESMLPFMMMRPTLAGPGPQSDMSEQTRPSERRHLFGSDWNSIRPSSAEDQQQQPPRSSVASSSGEREESSKLPNDSDRTQLSPDPLQLLRMMLRTFAEAQSQMSNLPDVPESNRTDAQKPGDLEKSSSNDEKRDGTPLSSPFEGLFGKPKKPSTQNETREDVVEIEGKKYLRKTVLNRHVGENMVFVTRRLIFVPLNETDSTTTSTKPENLVPTTTLSPSNSSVADNKEASTTTQATTTTSTTTTLATPIKTSTEEPTTTTTTSTTTTVPTTTIVDSTTEKTKDVSEPKP